MTSTPQDLSDFKMEMKLQAGQTGQGIAGRVSNIFLQNKNPEQKTLNDIHNTMPCRGTPIKNEVADMFLFKENTRKDETLVKLARNLVTDKEDSKP